MQMQKNWNNFKNILCVRMDNLGDVLMTTPAIRALKKSVPERKITLLTSSAGSSIAKYVPEIDEIMVFDTPWEKNLNGGSSSIEEAVVAIRGKKFDAAVLFNVYSQNPLPAAMLCYMAGIPRVAGYCRENPYKLISDWIPDEEPLMQIKHEVCRQMDLAKSIGGFCEENSLSLEIPDSAKENLIQKLQTYGIDIQKKIIIIHPGVSESKRQFPLDSFSETAKIIVEELGYQVVLTGVSAESSLTQVIHTYAGENTYDLAGKLSMEELIALIRISSLIISNNTGPAHIAAAVNTPVVVTYALTNPQHAPWNVNHRILPFEIPFESQSKNVIVRYANKKTFKTVPCAVTPRKIVNAAVELLQLKESATMTKLVYVE